MAQSHNRNRSGSLLDRFAVNGPRVERAATVITGAVVAVCLLAMLFRFIFNPMDERRAALETKLALIKPRAVTYEKRDVDCSTLAKAIAAKPAIWDAIVPPPPPPPPPPEPEPDLMAMLKDICVTRQQIGDRVRISSPADPRGTFVGVGDSVKGAVIKSITREEVTFSLDWKGKELTLTLSRR